VAPEGEGCDNKRSARVWYLYILECADGSLYCGIAVDVPRRLSEHRSGKGAKYTRSRLPLQLIHSVRLGADLSAALRAERQFKALTRTKKLEFVLGSRLD
jgi:putative endonuclease